MIWRRLFSLFIIGAVLLTGTVSAQDSTTTPIDRPLRATDIRSANKVERDASKTALEAFRAAKETDRLTRLIAYGQKTIDERLAAIEKHQLRIEANKCTETTKIDVEKSLSEIKTKLTTARVAIGEATSVDQIKSQIQSVFENHRVYSFLIPATNGACHADRIVKLIDGKLTDGVDKLKTNSIDTATLEPLIAAAKLDAQSAYDLFTQVAAAPSADDAKTKMESARTALKDAQKSLQAVKAELTKLVIEYRTKNNLPADATTES